MQSDLFKTDEAITARPVAPKNYIAGLDGIRAVSVLLVMIGHYGFKNYVPGGLGVTIFFFISGFLITTLLAREVEERGHLGIKAFYIRRFVRLAPELFMLLGLGIVASGMIARVHLLDVLGVLSYSTNYIELFSEKLGWPSARWPHLWSLAVEEHFYFVYPVLFTLLYRQVADARKAAIAMTLLCVAVLIWRLTVVYLGSPFGLPGVTGEHPYSYVATDCRIDSLLIGCICAVLFREFSSFQLDGRLTVAALMMTSGLMVYTLVNRDPFFREGARYTLQGIAIFGGFLLLYRSSISVRTQAMLEWPLLKRLGVLSYGAYLWHLEPVIWIEHSYGIKTSDLSVSARVLLVVVFVPMTFLISEVSFRAVAPARRLRLKLHSVTSA